jgi:hypothetical protein
MRKDHRPKVSAAFRAAIAHTRVVDDFGNEYRGRWAKVALAQVVDDFGVLEAVRRCPTCMVWKVEDGESFSPMVRDKSGAVTRWFPMCKPCKAAQMYAAAYENREQLLADRRAQYRLDMKNEEKKRERREYEKAYRAAQREKDPEHVRKLEREKGQRYRARLREDPARHAAWLETMRINYKLKREREGHLLEESKRPSKPLKFRNGRFEEFTSKMTVDGVPLERALKEVLRLAQPDNVEEYASAALGVSYRRLREWKSGRERPTVITADSVLTAAGLLWWEVWDPAEYPDVAAIFSAAE